MIEIEIHIPLVNNFSELVQVLGFKLHIVSMFEQII